MCTTRVWQTALVVQVSSPVGHFAVRTVHAWGLQNRRAPRFIERTTDVRVDLGVASASSDPAPASEGAIAKGVELEATAAAPRKGDLQSQTEVRRDRRGRIR